IGHGRAGRDLAQRLPYLELEWRALQVEGEFDVGFRMVEQARELLHGFAERRRVLDEVGIRKARLQIDITEFDQRKAALGQRRNEGPEGALAHGIADHRGHGLLHGWTGNIGTASSTCAPPADWNSDFHRHIESVMPDLFDLETRQTLG